MGSEMCIRDSDKRRAVLFALIEDAHDVLVVKTGNDLSFLTKALHKRFILAQRCVENLDRYRSVEELVARQKYVGRTAGCELTMKLVAVGENFVWNV